MKTTLINASVIDGISDTPLSDAAVVIEDSVIAYCGPQKDVHIDPVGNVIDLKSKTIMPLLIDGHMHVTKSPGSLDRDGFIKTNLDGVGNLQAVLRWGTGTVAHAAGSPQSIFLRDCIKKGSIRHCSDLLVGGLVTATCGHVRAESGADGPWEIRKAARAVIAAGTDHIKTCASGGFQWDHEKLTHPDYTLQELKALVDIAHSRQKKVHVHAHANPGLANAIEAGCDVILHGALIDEPALEAIAKKQLWYMPTLYITSEHIWKRTNLPEKMKERMKEAHPKHRRGVELAIKMGLKLAAGTDGRAGSIMNEIRLMTECGLAPIQAINIATAKTASCLSILENTGSISKNKTADILVLNKDPLKDINILCSQDSIDMVIKKGFVQPAGRFDFSTIPPAV